MTTLGDLLGDEANRLMSNSANVGDVFYLELDSRDGITPKLGDTRNKFFIVLGFNAQGDVIGGLVINSHINYNLPSSITDYQMPISKEQCPFLLHDSFVNCSHLITANKNKFKHDSYRGHIDDEELMGQIVGAVKESPTANPRMLREFGII